MYTSTLNEHWVLSCACSRKSSCVQARPPALRKYCLFDYIEIEILHNCCIYASRPPKTIQTVTISHSMLQNQVSIEVRLSRHCVRTWYRFLLGSKQVFTKQGCRCWPLVAKFAQIWPLLIFFGHVPQGLDFWPLSEIFGHFPIFLATFDIFLGFHTVKHIISS